MSRDGTDDRLSALAKERDIPVVVHYDDIIHYGYRLRGSPLDAQPAEILPATGGPQKPY